MKAAGRVFKYGDNVDTDVIISARYLNTSNYKELASHCMEDIDPGFVKAVQPGDIIVAGENFGCGSSREHAPIAIRECGVSCVVASNFARIFYRNSINIGLPILECPQAYGNTDSGDYWEVDFETGIIHNITKGETYQAQPFPPFIQRIIAAGGLLNALRAEEAGHE
jgi:3-isopropylmalate/(R)-2-methylmalate dehydratase small subunit